MVDKIRRTVEGRRLKECLYKGQLKIEGVDCTRQSGLTFPQTGTLQGVEVAT